jgi:hypothetical protein
VFFHLVPQNDKQEDAGPYLKLLPSNFFYSGFYFSRKKAKEGLQKGAFQHNFNPKAPMFRPACLLVSMQGKMAESIHPQTEKHGINPGELHAAVLKGD